MQLGRKKLHPQGGFNRTLRQRGERGRQAQRRDDRGRRLDGRARPSRCAGSCCPIYFGLAIVVEEDALAAQPELAAAARPPRVGTEGRLDLLELSERIRLEAAAYEQAVWYSTTGRLEQAGRRYVDLLKGVAARRPLHRARGAAGLHRRHRGQRQAADARAAARPAQAPQGQGRGRGAPRTAPATWSTAAATPCRRSTTPTSAASGSTTCTPASTASGPRACPATWPRSRPARRRRGVHARLPRGLRGPRPHRLGDPIRSAPTPPTRRRPTVAEMLDLRPDVNQVRQAFERFGLLDERVRFLQGEWSGLVTQADSVDRARGAPHRRRAPVPRSATCSPPTSRRSSPAAS